MRRILEGRSGFTARLGRLLVFGKKSQNLVDEDFEYPTFKRASVLKPRWIARRRDPAVFDGFFRPLRITKNTARDVLQHRVRAPESGIKYSEVFFFKLAFDSTHLRFLPS